MKQGKEKQVAFINKEFQNFIRNALYNIHNEKKNLNEQANTVRQGTNLYYIEENKK